MKTYHCNRCQQLVFFENVRCERCEALLGYLPEVGEISAFEAAGDGLWRSLHPGANGGLYRQCHNYAVENVCNWMVPAEAPDTLCRACQFTGAIPNLEVPGNRLYWYRLETAKRRLLYTLTALGLPLASRRENPETGLQFDFRETTGDGDAVITGHDRGLITLNVAEADDAAREQARTALHEPYRTLLGHFRHETGHYFFDRLIAGTRWEAPFRQRFGDERADYAEALKTYYDNGPPADWAQSTISAYATMHPWEDWAETWAHYLHMMDAVDTALGFGMSAREMDLDYQPFPLTTLYDPEHPGGAAFLSFVNAWIDLAGMLTELSRAMGQPDFYPFVLPPAVNITVVGVPEPEEFEAKTRYMYWVPAVSELNANGDVADAETLVHVEPSTEL